LDHILKFLSQNNKAVAILVNKHEKKAMQHSMKYTIYRKSKTG